MQAERTRALVLGVVAVAGLALALIATLGGSPDVEHAAPVAAPARAADVAPSAVVRPGAVPERNPVTAPAVHTDAVEDLTDAVEVAGAMGPSAAAPQSSTRIAGRTVDEFGAAVAGVELRTGGKVATSGEDGRFALEVELGSATGRSFHVDVARAGYGSANLEVPVRAGETSDVGDLVMKAIGLVTGRVVDERGAPLGDVELALEEGLGIARASRFTGPEHPLGGGRTDAEGRILLESPARAVRVWAGGGELAWSASETIEVPAGGEVSGVEIVVRALDPEDTIELVVLDPSLAPVPNALVRYSYDSGNEAGTGGTNADEHGRLRVFVSARAPHQFTAFDPKERYRPGIARDVAPGAREVELRLAEHALLRVRVRDPLNAPVEEFGVELVGSEEGFREAGGAEKGPHRDGIAELVLPVVEFRVVVDADGYQLCELGPFDPEDVADPLIAELVPLPAIRGRVTGLGKALEGAEVSLHEALDEKERYIVNGFPCRSVRFAKAHGRTDDEGEFAITLRESGRWYLRAAAPGFAAADTGPFELDPARGGEGLAIDLGRGGRIRGNVLLHPGEEKSGWIVGASRGDGFGFTTRTDADGEFAFEGLAEGRWLVEWREEEIRSNSTTSSRGSTDAVQEVAWNCEVHEGRTTSFELDLRALRVVSVAGRFTLGGAPLVEARARLVAGGGRARAEATTIDARGAFRLETGAPGEFELEIDALLANGARFRLVVPIALERGETPWELDLPAGRIEGRALPELLAPNSTVEFAWSGAGGMRVTALVPPRADGTFEVPAFPAGAAEVSYRLRDGGSGSSTVNVVAGSSAALSIP